jgi:hypothetical protein
VVITVPYLLILNHVSSLANADGATGRQFLLMTSGGADRSAAPRPIFLSAIHPLERQ